MVIVLDSVIYTISADPLPFCAMNPEPPKKKTQSTSKSKPAKVPPDLAEEIREGWAKSEPSQRRLALMKTLKHFIESEWVLAGLTGFKQIHEADIIQRAKRSFIRQYRQEGSNYATAAYAADEAEDDLKRIKTDANRDAAASQLREIGNDPDGKFNESVLKAKNKLIRKFPEGVPDAELDKELEAAVRVRLQLNKLFPEGVPETEIENALECLSNNQRTHCASTIFAKLNAMRYMVAKIKYVEFRPSMAHDKAWEKTDAHVKKAFGGHCPVLWEELAFDKWMPIGQLKYCNREDNARESGESNHNDTNNQPSNISGEPLKDINSLKQYDSWGFAPVHSSAILDRFSALASDPKVSGIINELLEIEVDPTTEVLKPTKAGKSATDKLSKNVNENTETPTINAKKVAQAKAKGASITLYPIDLKGLTPLDFEKYFQNKSKNNTTSGDLGLAEKINKIPYPLEGRHELLLYYYMPMAVFKTKEFEERAFSLNFTSQTWREAQTDAVGGLTLAVHTYDPNTGIQFETWAKNKIIAQIINKITSDNYRTQYSQSLINKARKIAVFLEGSPTEAEQKMKEKASKIEGRVMQSAEAMAGEGENRDSVLCRIVGLSTPSHEHRLMLRETIKIIHAAIPVAKMTEQQRQIFTLAYSEGLTNKEIAIAIGTTDGFVIQELDEAGKRIVEVLLDESSPVSQKSKCVLNANHLAMDLLSRVKKTKPKKSDGADSEITNKAKI